MAATKKPLTTQDGAEAHVNSAHTRQRSAVLSSLPESKWSLPALCSRPSSRARQGQERGWVFEKKRKKFDRRLRLQKSHEGLGPAYYLGTDGR